MERPIEPADRDRRRATRDRRRAVHDRRNFWPRFTGSGAIGAVVRWFTGPWTSANGLSWMRLLILFLIIRWGVLTVYSIPSESMEPVLHGDTNFAARDRVAVNKLAFGPRVPFTTARIFETGAPKRWDIVVFDSPAPSEEGQILIKRVVGLPGERVRVVNGGILVDGKRLDPPEEIAETLSYLAEYDTGDETIARLIVGFAKSRRIPVNLPKEPRSSFKVLREDIDRIHTEIGDQNLDAISRGAALRLARSARPETWDLVRQWWIRELQAMMPLQYGVLTGAEYATVPEGFYFCLGDNGPESFDSRMFGWVAKENLIGRAFAIVTPPGRARDLSGFSSTPRGRLILYGSIALLLAWEIVPGFILFSLKLRGSIPSAGLRRGEHVVVDRLTYGLRIPFLRHRFVWWRAPRPGEILCYRMSRSRAHDVYFGEVKHVERAGGLRVVVTGPPTEGDVPALYALTAPDIVGLVRAVWLPGRRRRRIRTAASRVESPAGVDID